jgi:hypothetical protein
MKSANILLVLLSAFLIILHSCNEKDHEDYGNLTFHSLIAEKDTIAPGETVKITASASGNRLEYFWSATLGDILGSGPEVVYAASPCSAGKNRITCRIESGSRSETKTIDITVYE